MAEILIGPSLIKKLWKKLFPKNRTSVVQDTDIANVMGIPDWVRTTKPGFIDTVWGTIKRFTKKL